MKLYYLALVIVAAAAAPVEELFARQPMDPNRQLPPLNFNQNAHAHPVETLHHPPAPQHLVQFPPIWHHSLQHLVPRPQDRHPEAPGGHAPATHGDAAEAHLKAMKAHKAAMFATVTSCQRDIALDSLDLHKLHQEAYDTHIAAAQNTALAWEPHKIDDDAKKARQSELLARHTIRQAKIIIKIRNSRPQHNQPHSEAPRAEGMPSPEHLAHAVEAHRKAMKAHKKAMGAHKKAMYTAVTVGQRGSALDSLRHHEQHREACDTHMAATRNPILAWHPLRIDDDVQKAQQSEQHARATIETIRQNNQA